MNNFDEAMRVMKARFGKDSLISVATVSEGRPYVRTVDGYYKDGAFYTITYALSNKMKHIEANPEVAICGEWFTAHGAGENHGYVGENGNAEIMETLRDAFSSWYSNGHVDENDRNTCLLCVRLTDGVLFSEGARYEIDFVNQTA